MWWGSLGTRYWIITKLSIAGLKENKGQCQEQEQMKEREGEKRRVEKGGVKTHLWATTSRRDEAAQRAQAG